MKEDCRETLRQAFLYIDGEVLSEGERIEIEQHLEECAPCLERYGLEQEVKLIAARLRGQHRCPDKLRAKITSLFDEA